MWSIIELKKMKNEWNLVEETIPNLPHDDARAWILTSQQGF